MAIVIRRRVLLWVGVAEVVFGLVPTHSWTMSRVFAIEHILMWVVLGAVNIWQSTRALPIYDQLGAEAKIQLQKKWLMEFSYMVFVLILVGLLLAFVFEVPAFATLLWISALACIGSCVLAFRDRTK